MAEKKVYFYSINLMETDGEKSLHVSKLKTIIVDIIKNNSVDLGDYSTIDLSSSTEEEGLHIMMDVFDYEHGRLFCRLSRQRPYNSMISRNYMTTKCSNVVPPHEIGRTGIEIFTYGILDYTTGIFAYVSAQSAPSERSLISLFGKYKNEYMIEMVAIPNTDAIEAIYYGKNPQISKLEIEVPVPKATVLEQIFNWDDVDMLAAVTENTLRVSIILQAPTRQSLAVDDDAKSVIDKLREKLDLYNKAKMFAKTEGSRLREYDLRARYFSYYVDIPKYYIQDSKRIEYTIEELIDLYRQNLQEAFETNRTLLTILTGRD